MLKLNAFVATLLTAFAIPVSAQNFIITNPYEGVDFSKQYKAGLHNHSTYSDAEDTRWNMIMDAYRKGFSVFTFNDHNYVTPAWDEEGYEVVSSKTSPGGFYYKRCETYVECSAWKGVKMLTTQEKQAIEAGTHEVELQGAQISYRKAGQGGMIGLSYTNEQTTWWDDHINSYWADFNRTTQPLGQRGTAKTISAEVVSKVQELGGVTVLNHPGRATKAVDEAYTVTVANSISSRPDTIKKYSDILKAYPSALGIEIINKLDGESRSDRILWDNLLKDIMPSRQVCGFSSDDAHYAGAIGYSYDILLMPSGAELNEANVRTSMENCAFLAFAHVAHRENINKGVTETPQPNENMLQKPRPEITDIVVSGSTITIEARSVMPNGSESSDPVTIQWIAGIPGQLPTDGNLIAGGNIIHEGATLDLDAVSGKFKNYVRANVKNSNGIIFVQPFGIKKAGEVEPELICGLKSGITKVAVGTQDPSRNSTWEVKCNNTTLTAASSSGFEWGATFPSIVAGSPAANAGVASVEVTANSGAGDCAGKKAICTVPIVPAFECVLKNPGTTGTVGEAINPSQTFNVYCNRNSSGGASASSTALTNYTVGATSPGTSSATPIDLTAVGPLNVTVRSAGANAANCQNETATCPAITVNACTEYWTGTACVPVVTSCPETYEEIIDNVCVDTRTEEQKCTEYWTGTACVPVVTSCPETYEEIIDNVCVDTRTEEQKCTEYWTGTACVLAVTSCPETYEEIIDNVCVDTRTEEQKCTEYWTGTACVPVVSSCDL
ncbi:MAG: hypothetical protein FWC26_00650, partial [Fibromonadales bacterium]|nr:hypothetical protein [Fibromonadales bacterium]